MQNSIKIAPSILSGDFMHMSESIKLLERAKADYVHVDVMDGHFVPNLTMGVPFVKQLKQVTDLPLDVHLMISNPLVQIPWFLEAGADVITAHVETMDEQEVFDAIDMVREAGVDFALAIKPSTPIEAVERYLVDPDYKLDMVLVMSVEPGFSGQSYIEGSEDRVAHVISFCKENNVPVPLIQVDGGIGEATVGRVAAAGASVMVCGSAFFKADDPVEAVASITEIANAACAEACAE